MKRLLSLLLVLALTLGALGGIAKADAAMSGATATANPNTPGSYAAYTIQLLGAHVINPSGWIQVDFSSSFTMPSGSVNPSLVLVNGSVVPSFVTIFGTSVYIQLSSLTTVPAGTISVVIQQSALVRNPVSSGNYSFTVSTSADGPATGTISIGTSGITGLSVFVTPATTGAAASWQLSFATSATGALAVGQTIAVTFPAGTTLPGSMPADSIKISSGSYSNISVTAATGVGSVLTMYVPSAMATGIGASAFVSIQILTTYGLHNTSIAGTYSILLATATDTLPATSNQVIITGTTIGAVTVAVSPLTPATPATYTLFFSTSAAGGLLPGDSISVQFPTGTGFPSFINPTLILVNGQPSLNATRSSYTLQISLPPAMTIPASAFVQVQIQASFGITNPATPGTYKVSVFTSKDSTPVQSSDYAITGTSITGLTLAVTPRAQSALAEYRLSFNTSSTGLLQAGVGTITVDFSSAVTLPTSPVASRVTVNGTAAQNVYRSDSDTLVVTTPVSVGVQSSIVLVFTTDFGIRNPASTGATVNVVVKTSSDLTQSQVSFVTTSSSISQPQVVLTTNGAGLTSGYTVTFTTGPAGDLVANQGRVSMVFPSGTVVPGTIATSAVRLNGLTPYAVQVVGQRVDVTVAANVGANAQIQVVFDKAAGIRNPSNPQSVALQAYTTSENSSVSSATYQIVALAHTTATVNPLNPDGLNGYYKTRPTVSIAITSGSSAGFSVYYRLNSGGENLYSSPIQVPDGNIVITYYARDNTGNQEDANTLSLKVKSTAPQIAVTAPVDGSLVGSASVTVSGRTDAGSSVTVNGVAATVQTTGDFSANIILAEGTNAIQIIATDVAGNIGQTRVNVTLDTKPPTLTITAPKIYSTVMTQQIAVTGKTEAGAIVTVAGARVNVAADGSFSILYMFPKEGLNVIDITSTDAAGNVAKTGLPVTYVARTLIRLQVANKTAMINDTSKTLQAAPVNVKGVVMVPLRFIGEAFGATVEWEPVFKIVRLQLGSTTIYLQVGTNYASVNGKKIVLQGLPSIIKGTTMVPIRFISEAFNAQVTWIAATQGIEITYPKP
ncbi:MAG: stalk domain-containing protein [Candidatus Cryosericum sp.]